MTKHEHLAWWRLCLGMAFLTYLCWVLFSGKPEVGTVGWEDARDNVGLFVVVFFLASGYVGRRKGIEEDERDRIISGIAGRSALFALILLVLASPMIMSGTAVPEGAITREADWLTFYAIACAMFAMSIEAAVTVFHHWRDRR